MTIPQLDTVAIGWPITLGVARIGDHGGAGCLRHSLLIRQPICVRAATRTMTARLG